MSGHSKWSTIKHKKAKLDNKRAKVFTKIGKEIMVAVKLSGSDPDNNSRLKLALQKARISNMPSDNIKKLIQKAAGDNNNTNYEELVYEGYGVGGAAVIVDVMTDNRNRTAGEIRHIFDKCGGNMGESGCVSWMFDSRGLISYSLENIDEDEITMVAIENGAVDVEVEDNMINVYTEIKDFDNIRSALEETYQEAEVAELTKIPRDNIEIFDIEQAKLLVKMMDLLEDNDDVQDTYSNFDFSDEIAGSL
ncbi:MAG: YebC/PmpR family DNA-binding regulatory protein [Fusobacteria bacterium]|nr:MAG: YebC/PmpR family DNA-binding regulatory protein [Fusobacteriota bacterium]KAF0229612.1 MAG: YebC/PmpR family DNA-binding regulatory [Fusobacteriota bacterium]